MQESRQVLDGYRPVAARLLRPGLRLLRQATPIYPSNGSCTLRTHPPRKRRLAALALPAAALVALSAGPAPVSAAAPGHTGVPAVVPSDRSPNILDGSVRAIYDNGTKVVAVGNFTQVQNRNT